MPNKDGTGPDPNCPNKGKGMEKANAKAAVKAVHVRPAIGPTSLAWTVAHRKFLRLKT